VLVGLLRAFAHVCGDYRRVAVGVASRDAPPNSVDGAICVAVVSSIPHRRLYYRSCFHSVHCPLVHCRLVHQRVRWIPFFGAKSKTGLTQLIWDLTKPLSSRQVVKDDGSDAELFEPPNANFHYGRTRIPRPIRVHGRRPERHSPQRHRTARQYASTSILLTFPDDRRSLGMIMIPGRHIVRALAENLA
jgi:hypothetical protein